MPIHFFCVDKEVYPMCLPDQPAALEHSCWAQHHGWLHLTAQKMGRCQSISASIANLARCGFLLITLPTV